ncbi:uncharacterized protein TrAtP1_010366 [Trichoderma atroviride]|uniref:P-loop containing nucleoside triphosphate hydrolase protein n=1 Tax=Hypocrea atroviridis (strain ATCC 20476 / IMI 206040) TaxID=452589 RepID=G9NR34_HYPAI|nr:uncharacterized protein TRIATDRAFT_90954 [Trichoderma atroviride IMI 206040]EHK47004.1 hypothetical protein TRIATDRAFT_90954 [Trichoderma atroviride IMI 206040]UKZ69358.1 hypothetical protein TrAtP1_010366 [Trichoderma atroviride]
MSRLIDRLPTPEKVKEKKVIVLSRSRVGTFSLYQALKTLGYTPYHMFEVVTNGVPHLQLFDEAIRCKYSGTVKPYGKAEFDKWLANYDAIVEIPQFFIEEFIEFYPNAKFILVERDVDAWERSLNNTVKAVIKACRSFPLNVSQYVDHYISGFVALHVTFEDVMFHNKGMEKGMEEAKRDVIADGEKAKRLAPEGQLLACTLEGGFGWEEICPFLEKDIPKTPYPRGNAPAEFEGLIKTHVGPRIRNSVLKLLGTALVPVVSIGLWSYMKRP